MVAPVKNISFREAVKIRNVDTGFILWIANTRDDGFHFMGKIILTQKKVSGVNAEAFYAFWLRVPGTNFLHCQIQTSLLLPMLGGLRA